MISFDCETTGLAIKHGCRPFMVTTCTPAVLAGKDGQTYWEWQVDPFTRIPQIPKKEVKEITAFLNDSGEELTGWHLKFDMHALESIGVQLPPFYWCHEAMYMLHAWNSLSVKRLKAVAYRDCDIPDDDEELLTRIILKARRIAKKLGWAIAVPGHPHFGGFKPSKTNLEAPTWVKMDMWLPRELVLRHPNLIPKTEDKDEWESCCRIYGLRDAYRTLKVTQFLVEELHQADLWKQYTLNRRCLPVIYDIEKRGVPVHAPTIDKSIPEYLGEYERYSNLAKEIAGKPNLNLRSKKQMTHLFYKEWGMPIERTTKKTGSPSLDATALMNMYEAEATPAHVKQFVAYLLISRKYKKSGEDYLVRYKTSGIVHQFYKDYLLLYPSLHITGPSTTRLASSNPNGQNIGTGRNPLADKIEEAKDISLNLRRVFRPLPGRNWFCVDYNQLQMRIIAAYTKDVRMLDGFVKGYKFHDVTCRALFDLREDEPFDSGQKRIAKNTNFGFWFGAGEYKIDVVTTRRPGTWLKMRQSFPQAAGAMDACLQNVKRDGYITTMGGYRLRVPKKEKYKGFNYAIQGTEGEIVKKALVDCYNWLNREFGHLPDEDRPFVLFTIHDEIIFDFPDAMPDKLKVLWKLCRIMEMSGDFFGVTTPVEAKMVLESWAETKDIHFPQKRAA